MWLFNRTWQEANSHKKLMPTYPAKIVCAWCKSDMGESEGFTEPDTVTHGICDKCKDDILKDTEVKR